jgi:hypothetical protein
MGSTPLTIQSTVPIPPDAQSAGVPVPPSATDVQPIDFSSIEGHVKHAADDVASWYLHSALGHALTEGPPVEQGAADVDALKEVAGGKTPFQVQAEGTSLTPGPDPEAAHNKPFRQFRQGLNNMADDMHKFADSHASQLTPAARALLHGSAASLGAVPVGSSAAETAAMIPFDAEHPPKLGPGKDFYSTLEHTIETKLPKKMTGEQLVNTLKNAGVPKAELANVEHLAGKPQVTREEALTAAREKTPHVETIQKSSSENPTTEYDHLNTKAANLNESLKSSLRNELGVTDHQASNILSQHFSGIPSQPWKMVDKTEQDWNKFLEKHFDELNDYGAVGKKLEELENHQGEEGAKYESYTLPGGKNYREVLLTLPSQESFHATGKGSGMNPDYHGPHFDEPNVVAHLRLNDRTIDGKKTLFIEELQSDWARELREQEQNGKKMVGLSDREQRERFLEDNPDADPDDTPYDDRGDPNNPGELTIPSMPFTNSWHELALKKALDLAAKEGYDQVAWTTGAQQADRYNLAKHVDSLSYNPETGFLAGVKNGKRMISEYVDVKNLPQMVGKDVAEKLLSQPKEINNDIYSEFRPAHGEPTRLGHGEMHTLKLDKDIQVGGEHHLRLYDEMVPQFLGRYTKKWGGAVGSAPMEIPSQGSTHPEFKHKGGFTEVQTLPITDQMREGIKRGQPLIGGGNIDFSKIQGHRQVGKAEAIAPSGPSMGQPTVKAGGAPAVDPNDVSPIDFSSIEGHVKHAADDVARWYLHSALGRALTEGPDIEQGAADVNALKEVAGGKTPFQVQAEGTSLTPGPDPEAAHNKPFRQFRQGLDNMADDMHKFADSHASQLTPAARALLHGSAASLGAVPVGSNMKETAAMIPFDEGKPPKLGPGKDFYSTLEHTIETKLPKKMTGEQLVNTLKNAGVPKAELTNVEHLAGKPQVTREEALAAAREKTSHVETIEKKQFNPKNEERARKASEAAQNKNEELRAKIRQDLGVNDTAAHQILNNFAAGSSVFGESSPGAKWIKSHQKELDEYRAILEERGNAYLTWQRHGDNGPKYESYTLPGGKNYREVVLTLPSQESLHATGKGSGMNPDYRGPHFDEPNVVAHLRLNDRTIDGKKTLFIEELQSDWARELRENREPVEGDTPADTGARTARDEARIPSMPFDKSWHELALKKALDLAAKEGYDQVAWTTGSQQADRYNLRKHYSRLTLSGRAGDTKLELWAHPEELGTSRSSNFSVKPEELQNYVGKDNAKQLLDQIGKDPKTNKYAELNLKDKPVGIGGEHHLRLYDEMVPQFLDRYTKKWGGQVGEAEVNFGPKGPEAQKQTVKVQTLPITPAMREGIKRGQPLIGGGNIDFSKIQGHRQVGEAEAIAPSGPSMGQPTVKAGGAPAVDPNDVAKRYGLTYRGEVSPGTGVHDFKAPDGGSFALKTDQLGDDKFIKEKLEKRKQEIKPEELHPVAKAKANKKLTGDKPLKP